MKKIVDYKTIIKHYLNWIKSLKEGNKHCQNQEDRRILDGDITKRFEVDLQEGWRSTRYERHQIINVI